MVSRSNYKHCWCLFHTSPPLVGAVCTIPLSWEIRTWKIVDNKDFFLKITLNVLFCLFFTVFFLYPLDEAVLIIPSRSRMDVIISCFLRSLRFLPFIWQSRILTPKTLRSHTAGWSLLVVSGRRAFQDTDALSSPKEGFFQRSGIPLGNTFGTQSWR